jgi:hypothetical protein
MPLPRMTALAVLLVHLFASVATGVVYLCQMSGQVGLSSCCCQHRPNGSAGSDGSAGSAGHADSPDAVHALGCCDASRIEANRAPALAEKRSSEPQPVAAPMAMRSLPGMADLPQQRDSALALLPIEPPPDGPPIYLRARALLL